MSTVRRSLWSHQALFVMKSNTPTRCYIVIVIVSMGVCLLPINTTGNKTWNWRLCTMKL